MDEENEESEPEESTGNPHDMSNPIIDVIVSTWHLILSMFED